MAKRLQTSHLAVAEVAGALILLCPRDVLKLDIHYIADFLDDERVAVLSGAELGDEHRLQIELPSEPLLAASHKSGWELDVIDDEDDLRLLTPKDAPHLAQDEPAEKKREQQQKTD